MSGSEIRAPETVSEAVAVGPQIITTTDQFPGVDSGEEFIHVLSEIASAADRNYTPITDTDPSVGEAQTIVAEISDDQYSDDRMAKLLTAIAVSSGTTDGHPGTVIQLVLPPSEPTHVAMVQKEVVVGSPDLSLTPACDGINEQPMAVVNIEEIQSHETTNTAPLYKEPASNKRFIFLTNFREYTISEVDGSIWIGERQEPGKKNAPTMVPATDNVTGFKFSYQYRRGSTVKRFEDKDQVIFFIGQVSNERILVLFLQTVYKLVHNVREIDLDREYSSGRVIKSKYYRGMAPSRTRTIRSPIEKLTYMKLLIVGDATQEEIDAEEKSDVETEETVATKQEGGSDSGPSEDVAASKTKDPETETEVDESKTTSEVEPVVPQKEDKNIAEEKKVEKEQVPQKPSSPKKKKTTLKKKAKSIVVSKEKTPGTVVKGKEGRSPSTSKTSFGTPDRGASKRKIRPPSKFVDFCDLPGGKQIKAEPESDEEDASDKEQTKSSQKETGFTASSSKNENEEITISGKDGQKWKSLVKRASPRIVSVDSPEKTNNPVSDLPSIDEDVRIIRGSLSPEKVKLGKKPTKITAAKVKSQDKKPPQKTRTNANDITSEPPMKRKRGRPRKGTEKEFDPDDPKGKYRYPSIDFQRAINLSKYLCQKCLTNHEAYKDKCPIVEPSESCLDQEITGSETRALLSLPSMLSVKLFQETRKLTVCAGQDIAAFTQFGPLVGILLSEEDIQTDTDLSHIWFLQQEDNAEKYFLYTGDETATNWCHYLHTVTSNEDYNVAMVLKDDGIFFTTSEAIPAGSLLKVLIPYFGNKSRPIADIGQMECLHCKRSFLSALDYQKHYHIFHPGGFTKQKQNCRLCKKSFLSMKDLENHMHEDHGGVGAFQCDQCPRSFHNPARLRVHQNDVHPPPEAAVPCQQCGKMYRSKRALANHMTNVHSLFKFDCQICEKTFDRRCTLLRHMRSHNGQSGVLCGRCGKRFRDRHNLKVHMLSHSGVKPFQCQFCLSTSFATRTCLKLHYDRAHQLSEDQMPSLERSVPFTMEAYSGMEAGDDGSENPKNMASDTAAMGNGSGDVNYIIAPKKRKQRSYVKKTKAAKREKEMAPSSEVTLHINEDNEMEVQEVVQEVATTVIPHGDDDEGKTTLPAYFTEMVQTDDDGGGGDDHCYYALNVDGQQVLVPATGEEVCVILEDGSTLSVPDS